MRSSYILGVARISLVFNILMHYVEDSPKDWLGRCASNHETIKVGQLDELVGVGLGDGSSVDDPYDFSLLGPNVLSDPPPDMEKMKC